VASAERVDEGLQLSRFDISIAPLVEVRPAGIGGGPKGADARNVLCLLPLKEAQAGAEHLACVLVPARCDQRFDERVLMRGQDDIACGHANHLSWHFMPMFPTVRDVAAKSAPSAVDGPGAPGGRIAPGGPGAPGEPDRVVAVLLREAEGAGEDLRAPVGQLPGPELPG